MTIIEPSVTPSDISQCNNAASFLQSGFWGSFKARFGWNARGFLIDWGELGQTSLMVIRRRLAPWLSFAYVPWGPELPVGFPSDDIARNQALVSIARSLKDLLPRDTTFTRFDPPWFTEYTPTNKSVAPSAVPPPRILKPFLRAGADIQPPDTVLLNIVSNESDLLARMKSKWRYNIRLAVKKGVTVRQAEVNELPKFYAILKKTAKRDGIAIHSIDYYEMLFFHCRDYPQGGQEIVLYLAEHEGETLAGAVVLFRGKEAVYLYGASSDNKRNLMAPYLVQWKAIIDAKAKGCTVYDFFGIPPSEDSTHPMAGLYRFKTGFGGQMIHRPGSWDYAYHPLAKTLFTTAESLRKKLRNLKKRG
ncbi:MAG: peptidoglycan bridge formation glycyltransferase FemA/FemB family protein [Treponema sp.]|jgi:lipid II:glycine glycyltransferase (peptidoglycan interpeptide bridge formation enzyme)|nr:peptidoglycan bridge formation glycyltransferase FemA/FemB family protein [Treponema sp.]